MKRIKRFPIPLGNPLRHEEQTRGLEAHLWKIQSRNIRNNLGASRIIIGNQPKLKLNSSHHPITLFTITICTVPPYAQLHFPQSMYGKRVIHITSTRKLLPCQTSKSYSMSKGQWPNLISTHMFSSGMH